MSVPNEPVLCSWAGGGALVISSLYLNLLKLKARKHPVNIIAITVKTCSRVMCVMCNLFAERHDDRYDGDAALVELW